MQIIQTHQVPLAITPMRLQEYGVGIFSTIPTRSGLKKALKKEYITVNGEVASTATFITGGETITLILPGETATGKKLIFPLRVLFEDEHLALVHKPAGIVVSGNSFKTLANALPQNLKRSELIDATTPQPVHRLDLATTGILLAGKTRAAIRALNKLFEDKEVEKIYYALCIGKMEACGNITEDVDGKSSFTEYKVLEWVASGRFRRLNLVELRPKTGRRHQLRKHLAGLGNPILGDKEYGCENLILKGKGLYLHAGSLKFTHPFTGETLHIQDGLPKKFRKIFPQPE
ncbi:RluA family pseudouridine synthase [Salinimicrobium sp. TH3]|uniref:RluA family pseudouridine synthase n=1 Tax=Salinimicrobium sp. TH3 TaxID=2997342 RepID=UPI0022766B33|nr:RluA family pseudouridine synthase [Salinimicrobium sp. TH3]MCY2685658.1 RluA family pseudouridine synthase [Salinimicrobium sp. TH3]